MTTSKPSPLLVLPAAAVHLVIVSLAWRDISGRSPAQLRSGKTLWRVVTALNAGNVVIYLLVGRRR